MSPPQPPRARPYWALPVSATAVVLVVAIGLAAWTVVRERHDNERALDSEGRAATTAIQAAVDDALEHSRGLVALFRASYGVQENEFASYVADIGYSPGAFGLGFVARVLDADRARFDRLLDERHPGRFLFGLDGLTMTPRSNDAVYYPISFFESPENLPAWGFDVASDPGFVATLRAAIASRAPSASTFTWFPGRGESDGVVIFSPVMGDGWQVEGVVAIALDVSDLMDAVLPASTNERPSPTVVDAVDSAELGEPEWVGEISVANREWLVGIDSRGGSPLLAGAVVLGIGIVAALASGLAVAAARGRLANQREVDRLQVLDRQKNEFLAAVSHELRTPLTSVLGFADELANHSGVLAADCEIMARTIFDEARTMEGIVADLLVAARLQDGQTIAVETEHIPDPAEEVRVLASIARAAVVDADPGLTALFADRGRFRQIVRNLLDNASRHGAPPVHVEVRRRGTTVEVIVRDHGPGVIASLRHRVFGKYVTSAPKDGLAPTTGIGLWVSRELARLMGGDLLLADTAHGAEFVLVLPAADAAQAVGF